jgi:hypothetical protein
MSSQLKSAVAAVTTGVTAVLQCVIGFTTFGSRFGSERTTIITVSAAAMIVIIAAWAVTANGDVRSRRLIGLTGLGMTLALAFAALWASFTYHNVVVDARRIGRETITSLRGPVTPTDVHIEFYTRSVAPIAFAGYGGTSTTGRAGVERFSDTKFMLHRLSSDQTIVLHHVSTLPVLPEVSADGTADLITRKTISRKMSIGAIAGGVLCGGAALLVWWFTSLQQSRQPRVKQIGFTPAK